MVWQGSIAHSDVAQTFLPTCLAKSKGDRSASYEPRSSAEVELPKLHDTVKHIAGTWGESRLLHARAKLLDGLVAFTLAKLLSMHYSHLELTKTHRLEAARMTLRPFAHKDGIVHEGAAFIETLRLGYVDKIVCS